jgi:phosphatidylserine/phosphatidylglycerophosphate/cardiolipin synthase-like enzyme
MVALQTVSVAGGDIIVDLFQQVGSDPFTPSAERLVQISAVASTIAQFIRGARSTLDIAIYDFRLHDAAEKIVLDAITDRAKAGVAVRIAYDAATLVDKTPEAPPAHVEADAKPPGTESFVVSLRDSASIRGITGYRVLMHNKYIVRDAASTGAAVLMGSANFTNDSWGLQENNVLRLTSQPLAAHYAEDFAALWSRGKIVETTGSGDGGTADIGDAKLTVAFTPGDSAAALKEIVGAISIAARRLYVTSVVISSGPILAALSEAIDRGLPPAGLYDGPQMDQVVRQWRGAHVGNDKINTWEKVASHLVGKNSIPYDAMRPHQPHNFMHNKLVIADDTVCTGSFNLSNHAMGNAENVLVIREAALADAYEQYIQGLIATYRPNSS